MNDVYHMLGQNDRSTNKI